jgi:8-oxo-dGTP pyrophosphatase MutT (NUDIX family)
MSQKPDWLRPHGRPWRRGAERTVYENPWIRVSHHEATAPTGRPAQYGLVSFKNLAIAVLPLHEDGTVTVVGQNRFALGDYSWELPEGGSPLGEDPLDGARRELAEETGLAAREWLKVLHVQLSNSVTDERATGYIALGLEPTREPRPLDDSEDLQLARVPFRELLDVALAGHIEDVLTVAMLLRAYHMAREGLLPDVLARAMLGWPQPRVGDPK